MLLISVDGMHQSDLDWYVANHPTSELARLATGGAEYTNAQTPDPSDSDPAGTGLMTGGDPKVTGNPYIELHVTEHGGHCGFVGERQGESDGYWAEDKIVDFISHQSAVSRLMTDD